MLSISYNSSPHLRPVPWNIRDAAMLFAFHFLILGLVTTAVLGVVRPTTSPSSSSNIADSQEEQAHPIQLLLLKSPPQYRNVVFVLVALSAVILAPLSEELLFRVVIQGALWNWEWNWWNRYKYHRVFRVFGRLFGQKGNNPNIPCGLATILLTAGIFSVVHLRPLRTSPCTFPLALCTTVSFILAQCISFPLSVVYLRYRGASFCDLGWKFDHIFRDVWGGIGRWYIFIVPLVFAMKFLSGLFLLPHQQDVLPIFVFAVMLSWVYFSNRRFIQVVTMHAALNGTSLAILYWQAGLH